jgi:hypothetical protein
MFVFLQLAQLNSAPDHGTRHLRAGLRACSRRLLLQLKCTSCKSIFVVVNFKLVRLQEASGVLAEVSELTAQNQGLNKQFMALAGERERASAKEGRDQSVLWPVLRAAYHVSCCILRHSTHCKRLRFDSCH